MLKFFSILLLHKVPTDTWFRGLHTYTYYYIKSDNVDEEHGHTGGTYLSALLATATYLPYSRND